MIQDYEQIVEKIAKLSGLTKEELSRRVEAKRAKLSGLISKEGAAQVIAAELGINFDKEKVKIGEIMPGMKKINVIGKIIQIFPVREFNKNNRKGKVANLVVADETSNIKIVLWDTHHIALIENLQIKEGDVVEITNASLRDTEIHLNGFSEIKLSSEVLGNVKTEKVYHDKNISELRSGDRTRFRAFILQVFEPKFFNVCPECSSKVLVEADGFSCEKHNRVVPIKRALMSIVLDDGTESMRAVLFQDAIEKIGIMRDELENSEILMRKRAEFLGDERFFSGSVRQNRLTGVLEFFVDDVQKPEIEELIKILEK